jgi:hypothetical protein
MGKDMSNIKNIIEMTHRIVPEAYYEFVSAARTLPEVIHKYGEDQPAINDPHLMTYLNEGGNIGSISFTRLTIQHKVLKNLSELFYEDTRSIWSSQIRFFPERVHLIRTKGNIVLHRDEAGRTACLNFGVLNSSSASTYMATNDDLDNPGELIETVLQDGKGYLVNTNWPHAVKGSEKERWLVTYGFGREYLSLSLFLRQIGLCRL